MNLIGYFHVYITANF